MIDLTLLAEAKEVLNNNQDQLHHQLDNAVFEASWSMAQAVEEALLEADQTWWCVPFQLQTGVDEPCVAGSTHDLPYECHWVVVVPVETTP